MDGAIAVIGAGGAIGGALTRALAGRYPGAALHAFARRVPGSPVAGAAHHSLADYVDEDAMARAAGMAEAWGLVIVATGILHGPGLRPEKALRDISGPALARVLAANTVAPALAAKHFVPRLARGRRAVFAALSARVGSISDNRLGGWYAYRASKAALNMVLKTASIEAARRNPGAIIVGLHPGTVDSPLSRPFQGAVPDGGLRTPDAAAAALLDVLDGLTPADTGRCFAWDGQEVPP
ncbi:MAG TPA: short-chain dehydrogenase [Rhodospirillaceae bacterium]|jgi:NAD(P)-dependent dehydrogenase (short-subunit alcohol dehydrogenase family)|nr:SDR family NAD(P)-dependent oxidoreductase [Alphaproteobacteria bacterium]HBH26296.1 short-chain dehydrogenase [Rhodospirillaceae bacterium]